MKNLKKLSRNDLRSVQGAGLGDCGSYIPSDPPLPGESFNCGCKLFWCEKRGSCVSQNMHTPQFCDPL